MDGDVMLSAQQDQVDESCDASIRRVGDVVGVAPRRRGTTSGPCAAPIPQFECSSNGRSHGADPSSDVGVLALTIGDNPDDAASQARRLVASGLTAAPSISPRRCAVPVSVAYGTVTVMWGRLPPLVEVSSLWPSQNRQMSVRASALR